MLNSHMSIVLFPGVIKPSSRDRSVETILAEKLDKDKNLVISPYTKIPPTVTAPCCKLVFRRVRDSSDPQGVRYSFVGTTSSEVSYTQMADFVYLPSLTDPRHIHASSLSKQSTPLQYNFDVNPMAVSMSKTGGNQEEEDQGPSVGMVRFKDPSGGVPTAPTAEAVRAADGLSGSVVEAIKGLFVARPVWQRASLEEALKETSAREELEAMSQWRLSHAIKLCTYFFLDGPWRNCYVRLGYDPRTDGKSREWQVIDFRDPFFAKSAGSALIPSPSVGGYVNESTTAGVTTAADIHFRRPPMNKSQLYQLCDIDDSGIQNILNSPVSVAVPSAQTGWLTETQLDSIRNQMKIKAESMRRLGL